MMVNELLINYENRFHTHVGVVDPFLYEEAQILATGAEIRPEINYKKLILNCVFVHPPFNGNTITAPFPPAPNFWGVAIAELFQNLFYILQIDMAAPRTGERGTTPITMTIPMDYNMGGYNSAPGGLDPKYRRTAADAWHDCGYYKIKLFRSNYFSNVFQDFVCQIGMQIIIEDATFPGILNFQTIRPTVTLNMGNMNGGGNPAAGTRNNISVGAYAIQLLNIK